ncbi:hypothetical protein SEA_ZION_35 [Corynebacterium phage Zion]|uniref:Uncharacterized protein n=3 Tax=Corynebacterium virus Zion TaxID=2560397 RepID=A0A2H4P8S1_9CAUD|nr:hypothetical protein FDJ12_gp35 [Corynebacterium phage Zion]ATW58632.1 hypothetical protein SEA_POTATOCHIP_35 [Corynebacterium phage PotatoChip]ATW58807.1 hypothetical protein SEA_ZION_35 [Corynebacterium phage Zion]AYR03295.1 hypothetical protein PETEYPAB_34 [Corynebacterium phage PeteyPab]
MATVNDIAARLVFTMDGDALDFEKTGRGVIVVEDNEADIPLPKGPKGDPGDPGEPGRMVVSLVLDETTDSAALEVLKRRSATWSTLNQDYVGYFAINEPTRSGFFYTRGGWVIIRNIFGTGAEIAPGEFSQPVTYANVSSEPASTEAGVVVYSFEGSLKAVRPDGTRVTIA